MLRLAADALSGPGGPSRWRLDALIAAMSEVVEYPDDPMRTFPACTWTRIRCARVRWAGPGHADRWTPTAVITYVLVTPGTRWIDVTQYRYGVVIDRAAAGS